jgi:hypothetical protein
MIWCISEPTDSYVFVFMCREQCCKLQASLCWLIWGEIGKEIVVQGLSLDLNSMRSIWEVHPLHSCVLREIGGHRRPSSLPHHPYCAAGIHLVTLLLLLTRISHLHVILTVQSSTACCLPTLLMIRRVTWSRAWPAVLSCTWQHGGCFRRNALVSCVVGLGQEPWT